MVALHTGAYIEGVLDAIEVYGKYATGFRLVGGTESAGVLLVRSTVRRYFVPYITRL